MDVSEDLVQRGAIRVQRYGLFDRPHGLVVTAETEIGTGEVEVGQHTILVEDSGLSQAVDGSVVFVLEIENSPLLDESVDLGLIGTA